MVRRRWSFLLFLSLGIAMGSPVEAASPVLVHEEGRGGYRIALPEGWVAHRGPSSVSFRPGAFHDCKMVIRCRDVRDLWTGAEGARFLLRNERSKRQLNHDLQVLEAVHETSLGGEKAWAHSLSYRDYIDEDVIHRKIVSTVRRNDETLTLVLIGIDASRREWRSRAKELASMLASFRFLSLPEDPVLPGTWADAAPSPSETTGGYPVRLGGRRSPVYQRRESKPVSALAGWGGTLPVGGGGQAPSAAGGGKGKAGGKGAQGQKGTAGRRGGRGAADRYWSRMLRPERFFKPETLWKIGKKGWRDSVLETVAMSDADAARFGRGAGPTDNSLRTEAEQKRALSFFNPNLKRGR